MNDDFIESNMASYDQEIERRAHPENFCNHANKTEVIEAEAWGYSLRDLIEDCGAKEDDMICIDCGQIYPKEV